MKLFVVPDLVLCQVVEVGVDVPDVSFCVIERAELFGLSQLHQIRGMFAFLNIGTRHNNYVFCAAPQGVSDEEPRHQEKS